MFIEQKYLITLTLLFTILFYNKYSYASDYEKEITILENYLNSIDNMSFLFEQKQHANDKEIGWMQIAKPNKLRIEYKGENDLLIIVNSAYLVLYKANDDTITSLSNDGPWDILTADYIQITSDENNIEANSYVKNIEKIYRNNKNYIIYDILMKNKSGQFGVPILLFASLDPFIIEGWTIMDSENKEIIVKITKILNINEKNLDPELFKLSEKERISGKLWKGPFEKDPIKRKPKYRN